MWVTRFRNRAIIRVASSPHLLIAVDLLCRYRIHIIPVDVLLHDTVVHVEVDQGQNVRGHRGAPLDTE